MVDYIHAFAHADEGAFYCSPGSRLQIIFEEKEKSDVVVKDDCVLSSFYKPSDSPPTELTNFRTGRAVGTSIQKSAVCTGTSFLSVNSGTSYEFQRLNAASLHRAASDPKLGVFLQRVLPIIEEQLQFSAQQRQVAENL